MGDFEAERKELKEKIADAEKLAAMNEEELEFARSEVRRKFHVNMLLYLMQSSCNAAQTPEED